MSLGAAQPPAAGARYYTPRQMLIAALLGGPLAAALLMAENYGTLGQPGNRLRTVGFGVVGTLILLTLSVLLPENVPGAALSVGVAFGGRILAEQLQGPAVTEALSKGAALHGWGRTIAVSFGGLAATLLLAFGLALVLEGPAALQG